MDHKTTNDEIEASLRLRDEQLIGSMNQIKLGVFILMVLMIALLVVAVVLDMNSESFEKTARYRPPAEADESSQIANVSSSYENPVQGQTVYVPAYSHIYHQDGTPSLLTITLSVRNTSIEHEIIVKSVRYFDTEGKEVKSYLKSPLRLAPMATTEFLVNREDKSGGSGANFLVDWVSENVVSEPIIEAVMIGTDNQQGISFARVGSVIESVDSAPEEQ